jgi:coenzyme F420-reducing hydrogenase alpha subunit
MTTVLNRDSIKVKRDLQKRVENWVAEYCDALEENFKQYSIRSYKMNIDKPTEVSRGYKSYYEEQLQKIEDGTANLYKFDYKVGKKFIKVFNLQYEEANEYYGRKAGYRAGSVTAFIDKNTGQVYKPASWKAPAKHVRFDLRIIAERNYLLNPENCDWAGGHLYMR